jgi:Protein of unknown function (DUF3828)
VGYGIRIIRRIAFALAACSFSSLLLLSAATRIDDPKTFITEVYRHFVAEQSTHSTYTPPEDIYTARLEKLLRDDKRKAKGEVGCLDFVFWLNAQDWTITHLSITSTDQGKERKTVTTKFLNVGEPQEIHFDFRLNAGRWLLDDVHSLSAPPWTLSEILKCAP